MGCDIHFFVEQTLDGGETWHRAESATPNPHYVGPDKAKDPSDPDYDAWEDAPTEFASWYGGRNYSLFGMLADVRNGRGFAGVEIGKPVQPLDQPRGLPGNVSEDVAAESERWGSDGHSHSWFGLEELLQVDWQGTNITHVGWVGPEDFYALDKFKRAPRNSCGGIDGAAIEHVSGDYMRQAIADLEVPTSWTLREWGAKNPHLKAERDPFGGGFQVKPTDDGDVITKVITKRLYTQVEWSEPWSEAIGSFKDTMLRMTRQAITIGGAQATPLGAVRAVFWFDS